MEQELPVYIQNLNSYQSNSPIKNQNFNFQYISQSQDLNNLNGFSSTSILSGKSSQQQQCNDQFSNLLINYKNSEIFMENSGSTLSNNQQNLKLFDSKQQNNSIYLEEFQTSDDTPVNFSQQLQQQQGFKQKLNHVLSQNSQMQYMDKVIQQQEQNQNMNSNINSIGHQNNNNNNNNANINFNNDDNEYQQMYFSDKKISINMNQLSNVYQEEDFDEEEIEHSISNKKLLKLQFQQEKDEVQEQNQAQLCNFSQHCMNLDKKDLIQERKELQKLQYDIDSDIVSFINEMKKNERLQEIQKKIENLTMRIELGGYESEDEQEGDQKQNQQELSCFSQSSLLNNKNYEQQQNQKQLNRRQKLVMSVSNNGSGRNKKKNIQQEKWSLKKQQVSLQDIEPEFDEELDMENNCETQRIQNESNSNCSNKRKPINQNCFNQDNCCSQQSMNINNQQNNIFSQNAQQQSLFGQFNNSHQQKSPVSLFNFNQQDNQSDDQNNYSSNESQFGQVNKVELGEEPRKQAKYQFNCNLLFQQSNM